LILDVTRLGRGRGRQPKKRGENRHAFAEKKKKKVCLLASPVKRHLKRKEKKKGKRAF